MGYKLELTNYSHYKHDQLEQAMAEAVNSKRDAYQETVRRGNAEKNAIDAIRRVPFLLLSSYYFCNV